jgi:hypothetical protein
MISKNPSTNQILAEVSTPHTSEGSYIDWAAILAGGIFALALSFLLTSFGASLGLSLTSPYQGEGVSAAWLAIASGIWFAWVMVTGFGAGGYLCGRMRRRAGDATADEVEVRDGAHGLMVWATGALVGAVLAATGAGGFVSAGLSAAGTATEAATEAVSSDYFANVMLRSGVQEPETEATAGGATPSSEDADTEANAGGTTLSSEGAGTAATSGRQSAQNTTQVAGVDSGVQQEIASIITRSAANGEMAERDRSYLAQLVAANSDLDAEAARTRVDEVIAEIDDARAAALAAVEKARVAGVVFGFIAAATLLIGAAAAFFAATTGGRHRDEGLGLSFLMVRR